LNRSEPGTQFGWGDIKQSAFCPNKFDAFVRENEVLSSDKDLFVRDAYAGADPNHRLNLRVIHTLGLAQSIFATTCSYDQVNKNSQILSMTSPSIPAHRSLKQNPKIDGTETAKFPHF